MQHIYKNHYTPLILLMFSLLVILIQAGNPQNTEHTQVSDSDDYSRPLANVNQSVDFVYAKLEQEPLNSSLPMVLKKNLPSQSAEVLPAEKISDSNEHQYIYYNKIVNGEVTRNKEVKVISESQSKLKDLDKIGYWQTVHSIESKQGKLLYRPRNTARNCTYTTGPCGHHQLTVQALRDIGCKSLQCRKDRLDYNKSLKLSKKLLKLNEKRLSKNGLPTLTGYQKYLIHQQGASGIRNIIAATKGEKTLSSKAKKNMANNSPYSYSQFKRMGSEKAAKQFLKHWEKKWLNEKRLIAGIEPEPTDNLINTLFIPTFSDSELTLAFNYKF